ncbi:unnamed protein product [Sphagnum balticum]
MKTLPEKSEAAVAVAAPAAAALVTGKSTTNSQDRLTSPATSWRGSGQDGDLRVRGSHQRFRFLGVSRAPRSGNGVDLQPQLHRLVFAFQSKGFWCEWPGKRGDDGSCDVIVARGLVDRSTGVRTIQVVCGSG